MKVEYITHMGDDLMVVDAARVSFDKKSEWELVPVNHIQLDPGSVNYAFDEVLSEKDTKLINYLAKHNHWTPFAHPQIQVRVTAPIFIANQLKRSTVGLALNEVSRRYVDDEPTFYIPEKWRGRPPGSIKQGSSDEEIQIIKGVGGGNVLPNTSYQYAVKVCSIVYRNMLEAGVAPEMARMVLPQSMNTSWIWTGSFLAFMRIYKQRIDPHAQYESQVIAKQLGEILEKHFPVSFKAWTEKHE